MAAQWGFIFQFALERENDSTKSNVKCPSQYHCSQQNPDNGRENKLPKKTQKHKDQMRDKEIKYHVSFPGVDK